MTAAEFNVFQAYKAQLHARVLEGEPKQEHEPFSGLSDDQVAAVDETAEQRKEHA